MFNGNKVISFSILFAIGAILGLLFKVFQGEPGNDRLPQSIPPQKSSLSGELGQFTPAMRDTYFNSIEVHKKNGSSVVSVTAKEHGGYCLNYNKAALEFEADGVVVNGEAPKLKVVAPCQSNGFVVPTAQIFNGKPLEMEMSVQSEGGTIYITAKDLPPEWPSKWVLKSIVYFQNERPLNQLFLPAYERGMGRRNQIVLLK